MSAIFISHSSADNAVADELKALLAAHGHRSTFLDFDPAQGIAAGRDWEQALYAQLRACQAVVALCSSAFAASAWCFAELTHARALGKLVLPVKLDDGAVPTLLNDVQTIDLSHDRAAGWQRLMNGLAAAGLDPSAASDWDGSRPPYPGLLAFQRADAAVYFGRDAAVQSCVETLNRLKRLGGARLLLLLGASGSGKSSMVRAGVVPRLEHDAAHWRVAAPFRPLSRPFDEMALALSGLPGAGDWKAIRQALTADSSGDASQGDWREIVNGLRSMGAGDASLLLVVDQFEEALSMSPDGGAGASTQSAFLRRLRDMTGDPHGQVFVLATLRSDFLGALQTHPHLQGLLYEPIPLAQIDLGDIAQVIEGPARVAGLTLEPGLTQAMVADTVTDDALPLLAFTLRELYDRFAGTDRRLTLRQYRDQLGGLQGALARAAEALCTRSSAPEAIPSNDIEADIDAVLRPALLKLVRVDAEGRYARLPRDWAELPVAAHPWLERFVQARLLVSRSEDDGRRRLEVAHEALFRSWGRLANWLSADREFLLWQERLRRTSDDWRRSGADAGLTLRGPLLAEAKRWWAERCGDLDGVVREFIEASIAAQARRNLRRRLQTLALTATALLFVGVVGIGGWQWLQANDQRALARAQQLVVQSGVAQATDPVLGLLLTVQSLNLAWTPDGQGALLAHLDDLARPQASRWKPHPGPVRAMALSPDGRWLVTAGPGQLQAQSVAGELHDLGSRHHEQYMHAVAFSADGRWLAATCHELAACLYDTTSWQMVKPLPQGNGLISSLSFGDSGRVLATGRRGAEGVNFYAVPSGDELAPLPHQALVVSTLSFSPDGSRLAVMGGTGLELWDFATRKLLGRSPGIPGMSVAMSPEGHDVAVGGGGFPQLFGFQDTGPGVVNLARRDAISPALASDNFSRVALSQRYLAATDGALAVAVFDLRTVRLLTNAPVAAGALVFAADGHLIVAGLDGRISDWDLGAKAQRVIVQTAPVHALALTPDGRKLAAASDDDLIRIFDTASGRQTRELKLPCEHLAFSPDGRWLVALGDRTLQLLDMTGASGLKSFAHEARVVGVSLDGATRLATVTASQAEPPRWSPGRERVWDIETQTELGWRLAAAEPAEAAQQHHRGVRLALPQVTQGGDAALVARSSAWPEVFGVYSVSSEPRLPRGSPTWLAVKTSQGASLASAAMVRARPPGQAGDASERYAFSANGQWLARAVWNEVGLWPLRPADLMGEACLRLPRNLSCKEWREALGADLPYAKTCAALPDPPDLADCSGGAPRKASGPP